MDPAEITIGAPVVVHKTLHGICSFIGTTKFGDPSITKWYGICLTPPDIGKNDGSVLGVKYFECAPGQGLFTTAASVALDVAADGDEVMDASKVIRAIGSEQTTVKRPTQVPYGVANAADYLNALDNKIDAMVTQEDAEESGQSGQSEEREAKETKGSDLAGAGAVVAVAGPVNANMEKGGEKSDAAVAVDPVLDSAMTEQWNSDSSRLDAQINGLRAGAAAAAASQKQMLVSQPLEHY